MPETPPEGTHPPTPLENPSPPARGDISGQQVLDALLKQLSLKKPDDDDDDFAKGLAIFLVLALVVVLWVFVLPALRKTPEAPNYNKLEAIKRIQHLTLVRQHYETLIPITKEAREGFSFSLTGKVKREDNKPQKLEFLLKAPIEVSGYVDLSEVEFFIQPDSLVLVVLPTMQIDTPYLDWENIGVYTIQKGFLKRVASSVKKVPYLQAYDQIRASIKEGKDDVMERARINGLEEETEQKAKQYLMGLITSMGYRVQFLPPLTTGDSLGARSQLWLERLSQPTGRREAAPSRAQQLFNLQ